MLSTDEFKSILSKSGYERVGLCMFTPAPLAGLTNQRLNQVYSDSGDNLSVPLGRPRFDSVVRFWGGNYSSSDLDHALPTVDVFAEIPGSVLMVTHPGVGTQARLVIGVLEYANVKMGSPREHSFYSFAQTHLGLERLENHSNAIGGLESFGIQITGLVLSPKQPAQKFLKTPWEAIFRRLIDHPASLFEFSKNPRSFEEFIAESYYRAGYKVELTPQSGDGGVDIIAELPGHGAIKILDQTKAFAEHRVVNANDVRAVIGVLSTHPDASKAVMTTTSGFAPGVFDEFKDFTPTRLELRDGQKLISWLKTLSERAA